MIRCPKCGKESVDASGACQHCSPPLPGSSSAPEPVWTYKALHPVEETKPTIAAKAIHPAEETKTPGAACPACGAANDPDAAFCDQCGQSMSAEPEPAGCPECGGKVEDFGDGRGACAKCGAELNEAPIPAVATEDPSPQDLSQQLSRMILAKLEAGMALKRAVETSCQECLPHRAVDAPDQDEATACPVCGTDNLPEAARCKECGISFGTTGYPVPCPRCTKPCSADICPCGAVMTLSKLVEYVEPSVLDVCPRCKNLLTVHTKECPTCACDVIPADRLKAYAAGQ